MILDVTRHKFSEALLTLLFFAVAIAVVAGVIYPHASTIVGGAEAPLVPYITQFRMAHPTLSAVLLGLLYFYSVLRLSRATVRVEIYPSMTLSAIAVSAVTLFGAMVTPDYGVLAMSMLFIAETYGRLIYCFSASVRPHFLFSAMMALGALPLFDKAFIPLSIIVSIYLIVARGTLRETALTLLGIITPSFIYCYIMWLAGGDFVASFVDVWCENLISSHLSLAAYLTLPRLIYIGIVLFLQILAAVLYLTTPLGLNSGARDVWRVLLLSLVVLVVSLVMLPASSPSIIVAMALLSAVMLPLLFQYASAINATLAYVLLLLATLVPLIF